MMGKIAKVPMVMQMEALECGAACLDMILAYYGKWVSLEEIRNACSVSRDGSNAAYMLKAARGYGLKATPYRYQASALQEKVTDFPCILFWKKKHFVVLCGFTNKAAVINDPAKGKMKIPLDEFERNFSNIALMMQPEEGFEPGGKKASVVSFALKRLKGMTVPFILLFIAAAVVGVINLITPAFSNIFMEDILPLSAQGNVGTGFFLALFIVIMIQLCAAVLEAVYQKKIMGKLGIEANTQFFWHVIRLPVDFFTQRKVGDIVSRQTSNQTVSETLIDKVLPLALDGILIIFYVIIMVSYNPFLAIVGIVCCLINVGSAIYITNKRIDLTRVQMKEAGNLSGTTMSGIEMIETIKSTGAENGYFEKWSGVQALVNTADVNFQGKNAWFNEIPEFLQNASNIIVLFLGALLIIHGEFTIGLLLAFQGYLSQFMTPMSELVETGQSFQEMRTDMERIQDVLNYETDVDGDELLSEEEMVPLKGEISIRDLTFGYNRLGDPLIADFNAEIPAGGKIALVGSSGSGKSTLSKLICGLYSPWSGEILFDGKTRQEIPRLLFTNSFALVDQDITLFEDTIGNNITLWDTTIDEQNVSRAAADAEIDDEIKSKSGGYDYFVLEGGKNLSGGQMQRIEIARGLAQNPSIIILDEATSALDAKTEYMVMQNIARRGITMIIVAHRLSTIRDCDEIVVLQEGRVVDRGRHEQLMDRCDYYRELITTA